MMISGTMCFLTNREKTLFLYRNRGAGDIHNGWYVPPGGTLERGERSIDNILREFEEETGLKIINPKLRVIATFYNKGRLLGGNKNPEDWRVEVYEAKKFTGKLRAEHPKAKPVWIEDLTQIRMYPGDRKILGLLNKKGVWEAILQYNKENLARFDCKRVY